MFKGKYHSLFLYDPDKGAGADPAPPPPTGAAPNPTTPPTPEVKFTQADLDRIIAERLGRVEAKYADYADLKKKAEELETANKSELEKAIEKATKAEARQKEIETQTRERVITAEAKAIAAELGFSKPEKAIKLADLANATYGDDGSVSGVREALEALAKDMPELLTKKGAPQTGAANPAKTDNQATETTEQRYARVRGGGSGFQSWLSGGSVEFNPEVNLKQKPK